MRGLICLGLIAVMLFSSGCASMQKTKRIQELELRVNQLNEAVQQRDEQLRNLQNLLDSKDMQIRSMESSYQSSIKELQGQIKKYKAQPGVPEGMEELK